MTVQTLIDALQKLDPNRRVVVDGYEGGCDDIEEIYEIRLKLNAHTQSYYGKHKEADDGDCEAVYIGK